MELNESTYIVFEQHETYRNPTGRSIELRRIISRDIKDGETFAIVTNDKIEDTETIAECMLKNLKQKLTR